MLLLFRSSGFAVVRISLVGIVLSKFSLNIGGVVCRVKCVFFVNGLYPSEVNFIRGFFMVVLMDVCEVFVEDVEGCVLGVVGIGDVCIE